MVAGTFKVHEKCKEKGIESVFVRSNFCEHVGIRVTKAMNAALRRLNIKLERYDYILKVDDDVILPPKFLELCVFKDADCVGGSGCAELFKMGTFIKLFGGSFPEVVSDDTFMEFSVLVSNKKFSKWPVKPIHIGLKKETKLAILLPDWFQQIQARLRSDSHNPPPKAWQNLSFFCDRLFNIVIAKRGEV